MQPAMLANGKSTLKTAHKHLREPSPVRRGAYFFLGVCIQKAPVARIPYSPHVHVCLAYNAEYF